MATLVQEKQIVIPKLAQDLIAGTIGGWAQVVVGESNVILTFRSKKKKLIHRDLFE
jgi:hypothetical protein